MKKLYDIHDIESRENIRMSQLNNDVAVDYFFRHIGNNKNMKVDAQKLNQIYNEILLRDPDELAKGYVGHEEEFVRQELLKSTERLKIENVVKLARGLKVI